MMTRKAMVILAVVCVCGLAASSEAALVELLPTGLDDNFTIPVVAGGIMAIGYWL